jgi:hypothetical protein
MLMSRTRAYPFLRIGGAIFAGAASAGWVLERLFGVDSNIDMIVNALARHSLPAAIGLFLVSVACRVLSNSGPKLSNTSGGHNTATAIYFPLNPK